MIAFGAAFGYTVMARVSLLIGRMLILPGSMVACFQGDIRNGVKQEFNT
jgi:hypothetical protein